MPLPPGDKLGSYEIVAPLGAGGMGEVYRARDLKLNREVAIKVLPAALAGDAQYMARFEREAQMLAALNHPNIATVYGIEQGALVMELVEGADLKGPVPLDEALAIARQIAAGLRAAHEKGIIHRDLKPANIKITPGGVVKILDFGLAKSAEPAAASTAASASISPTLSLEMTRAGMILGTAAYMAPEQARGKVVDKRADIWAFGVVLYEILTAKRLFQGEDLTETLARVVRDRPDLSAAPESVRRLLESCLEKDPKKRLQDIGDLELLLAESHVPSPPRSRLTGILTAACALLAVALGISLWALRRTAPSDRPLVRLNVDLGPDVAMPSMHNPGSVDSSVVISPDGTRLAYLSGNPTTLFTRRLDESKATQLAGTQGAFTPFFSPDGKWIAFQSSTKWNKIAVEGGAVVPLLASGTRHGGSWGEDGEIYFGTFGTGLVRTRDGSGQPETVLPLGPGSYLFTFPQVLPGGKALLFVSYSEPTQNSAAVEVLTLPGRQRKTLVRGAITARYLTMPSGAGCLTYVVNSTLFAVPFDADKLEIRGTAVPILDDVASNQANGSAQLSFSRTGTLVYRKGVMDSRRFKLGWLDSTGKTQTLPAKPGEYDRPALSPDGQRLALEVHNGSGTDIWVYDLRRDTMTRLTFTENAEVPAWSPDGRFTVYRSGRSIMAIRSDGGGQPRMLTEGPNLLYPWSISADGKRLAFFQMDPKTVHDLWTVPVESDQGGMRAGKPEVFLQTPADERHPSFSPDGHWIAYTSSESGTRQIYARAFPDRGGKWQVSSDGGNFPVWSRSAHELFFETLDRRIMVASYSVNGGTFVSDKPRLWSDTQLTGSAGKKSFDLAPDGKRVVAFMPGGEAKDESESQHQVVFLMNFFDELRRRVPAGK